MRRLQYREESDEIAPSRVYFVYYDFDGELVPLRYPGGSPVEYSSLRDAEKAANYEKTRNRRQKMVIKAVPFDEVNDYYSKPYGGRKRGYDYFLRKTFRYPHEELFGRDEYKIFMEAANQDTSKPVNVTRGIRALQEYREGIERKKKTAKTKIKRKPVKKCKCK